MFSKIRPTVAAFLMAGGVPAITEAEPVPGGFEQVSARIDHADLDLTTPEGQAQFRKRVRLGIERMCTLSDPNNPLAGAIRRECVELSSDAAERQVSVAFRKARERAGEAALAAR